MANTYRFANADNSIAIRAGEEQTNLPWDKRAHQPADIDGAAGRTWKEDGSPIPTAYQPPPGPTEWPVPKSVVISRLTDQQMADLLGAMTAREISFWRASDLPTVMSNNQRMRDLITQVGADPNVVLAPPPATPPSSGI